MVSTCDCFDSLRIASWLSLLSTQFTCFLRLLHFSFPLRRLFCFLLFSRFRRVLFSFAPLINSFPPLPFPPLALFPALPLFPPPSALARLHPFLSPTLSFCSLALPHLSFTSLITNLPFFAHIPLAFSSFLRFPLPPFLSLLPSFALSAYLLLSPRCSLSPTISFSISSSLLFSSLPSSFLLGSFASFLCSFSPPHAPLHLFHLLPLYRGRWRTTQHPLPFASFIF